MNPYSTFHVHTLKKGWCLRRSGSRTRSKHLRKADAVANGRLVARMAKGTLIIHDRSGLVTARHSYK